MAAPKPVLLCILDGWGLRDAHEGNAPLQAFTPNFDRIMKGPSARLITFGRDVGLPDGQMGNSEVGHTNIGAGRVVLMDLQRINSQIETGTFSKLDGFKRFTRAVAAKNGKAHLLGVLSDGGVHCHIRHIIKTANILADKGIKSELHLFTDGRDRAPKSALRYLTELEEDLPRSSRIASIMGRYFPMDRDNRWERVEKGYRAIMDGRGDRKASAKIAISDSFEMGVFDEFIEPCVIGDYAGIQDGDGVLCLNFRADRARQIMAAIADPGFDKFDISTRAKLSIASGMVEYSDSHNEYMDALFVDQELNNTLGEWVAKRGLTQYRIAETEKYPHVTFFMNGGNEVPSTGEDRYLAPSPKVATYDLEPEMSANEVTENLVATIRAKAHHFIVVNYANPDMVGHTGDLQAAITACEVVDKGLGEVMKAIDETGGAMLLCADHGNCETMIDPETGAPHTSHTTNLVPVALWGGSENVTIREMGILADIAPTLLELLNLPQPQEMTGRSLIQ